MPQMLAKAARSGEHLMCARLSPNRKSTAEQPIKPPPFVRIKPRIPERLFAAPIRFQIVLNEDADAMRAAIAVANRVDTVCIPEDQMPCLRFRAKYYSRADAGV